MVHEPVSAPPGNGVPVSICFVCEPGPLEAKALLLAASLRDLHPDLNLVVALPGPLPDATMAAFSALGVAPAAINNPLDPDYRIGHKLAALGAGNPDGLRVFLDSDMLCLRPLDWAGLATTDLALKPVDVRTFGDRQTWQRLYRRFGLPAPAVRVVASVDEQMMYPYFNAGMVATTRARRLAPAWIDACRAIDTMQDIQPRRPWLDQIGLPLAAARLRLTTRCLGECWNYPAHIKPLFGTPGLVHYHLPGVVAREALLRQRVAHLLSRYPRVAAVVAADAAWSWLRERMVAGQRATAAPSRPPAVSTPHGPHGPNAELIITGIPRSGTSYLCNRLDGLDNTAVINEPHALFEGLALAPSPWIIPMLHADLRTRINAGEAVDNKLDTQGRLVQDTARGESVAAYRPQLRDHNWLLASKNTLAYMARLDGIFRLFPQARVVACVRHPLDTLASWKGTFAHLAEGDPSSVPVGGLADPHLPAHLRSGLEQLVALPSAALRRAAWWRLLAAEILRWRERLVIVRYENLVVAPERELPRLLGPLAAAAGQPVRAMPPSSVRTTRREQLDAHDWQALEMLCAAEADALGYPLPPRPSHLKGREVCAVSGSTGT